jgi:hypothetical protein
MFFKCCEEDMLRANTQGKEENCSKQDNTTDRQSDKVKNFKTISNEDATIACEKSDG